ncbi:MAG: hypothetical protein GY754_45445 [bacterium]|nr:hypothetical protein [bacterium]
MYDILTIRKKSLSDWRAAAAVIMLLSSVLLAGPLGTIACKSGQVESGYIIRTENWTNENTYRLNAAAMPEKGLTDIAERKASAKRAAVLSAQEQILEKFKDSCSEGGDYESGKEIIKIVRNGKVIEDIYDNEQNCEVTYEVKSRKLKKKVRMAAFR